MTTPLIREATAEDAEILILLWAEAELTRPWNDPRIDFDLALANPTSTIFMLTQDERLMGSVMVGFDGHRGWVYYLAVVPDARRCGLGRALMRAAEDWLVDRGVPKIQLMVRSDNTEGLAFYAALGLEVQAVTVMGRRLDGR